MDSIKKYIWAAQQNSQDIAHLPIISNNFFEGKLSFKIDAQILEQLCQQSHFPLNQTKILFGIRAAKTTDKHEIWLDEGTFYYSQPDHLNFHCTLGIWDRESQKLAFFKASTVPNAYWMQKQQNTSSPVANLLMQGLHQYCVGPHEPPEQLPQEGAFSLNRQIDVGAWRCYEGEGFSLSSTLCACYPSDNIHAAQTKANDEIQFSSAGCQTILGNHTPPDLPMGSYQKFREMAGQTSIPDENQLAQPYQYLLISSAHLFAIAHLDFQELRFFIGSVHPLIRTAQEYLINHNFLDDSGFNRGQYHGKTALAVWNFQKQNHLLADGILKPQDLKKMGISV